MTNIVFPLITEYESRLPYYITGVGYHYLQEHVIRHNGHSSYQWIQCYEGRGELKTEGMIYTVGKNQGMLLYPNSSHEYYALEDRWVVDWITFEGLHIEDFMKTTAGVQKSGVFYVYQPDIINSKIRRVLDIELSCNPLKSLECSTLAYDILVDLLKSISIKDDNSMALQYNRLSPLLEFIDRNYANPLTLAQLAEVIGVTPQYLCSLFKKTTGLRAFEYINRVRVKKSKEIMHEDLNISIKEVARLSGYDDVSYFCLIFKKLEHITPNEFRYLLQ